MAYGKSVNRPEFREVSPSVYYDFDLASHVQGNVDLKSCYIHNVDLRYEFYPSRGEQITIAGFYKHFDNLALSFRDIRKKSSSSSRLFCSRIISRLRTPSILR